MAGMLKNEPKYISLAINNALTITRHFTHVRAILVIGLIN